MAKAKAQELVKLCRWLRQEDVHFFAIAPGRRGHPDLVIVRSFAAPVAVWLRRDDPTAVHDTTDAQSAQIEKVESRGWSTLVAFGAQEALQEIHRRSARHAIASTA